MTSATTKFIKLPNTLLYKYNELSIEAKYLYAFLLDRHSLSIKKHILDKNNEPYVICTQQEASELLNISIGKVVAVFKDLEQHSLITRIKQGQGKPARIYVNNILAKSSFIKIPKDCSNAILNKLSIAELVLYALLKSKTEKSQINNWIENNQVFVSYKQSKIAEIFNMGKKKVIAMFKSLVTNGLLKLCVADTAEHLKYFLLIITPKKQRVIIRLLKKAPLKCQTVQPIRLVKTTLLQI